MRTFFPVTSTAVFASVTASAASLAGMVTGATYLLASSTNCWIKQGTCDLVTCVSKANFLDTDYVTIVLPAGTVVYEFDKAGNGVTAGRVQVNISTDTTAAQCAARLRTAILANQSVLEVTDNADGTLTICAPSLIMTITGNVANVGFTIALATVTVTAGAGSMFIPTSIVYTTIDGTLGGQIGILRNTADGSASLTRAKSV